VQNNRVWERACGLSATVVEGVQVDDKASAKPSTSTSITAFFKYGSNRQTPRWVCSPPRSVPRPLLLMPLHCSPRTATHHDSQAETDPQIQQESDICATWTLSRGSAYCRLCASRVSDFCDSVGATNSMVLVLAPCHATPTSHYVPGATAAQHPRAARNACSPLPSGSRSVCLRAVLVTVSVQS